MTSLAELCGHTFYLPAIGPKSIIIDLGASTAAFSIGVNALTGCMCHCVEAAPKNFQAIKETAHIKKSFAALCATNEPVNFYILKDEFHWGTLRPPDAFEVLESHNVPGKTLERLMYELKLEKIDLLKVDIEGAEIDMFNAADDATLQKIHQLTVEFHDFMCPDQREAVRHQIRRFNRLGFDCVVMTHKTHGDVWMVNRKALGLSVFKIIYFKTILKYTRGIQRILYRTIGQTKGLTV